MLIYMCTVIILMIYDVEGLKLKQSQPFWIKLEGKTVDIKCEVEGLGSSSYVHWYLKKDGETLKRVLYISAATGSIIKDAKEFEGQKTGNFYNLKLGVIKKEHAGVYYCAAWDGSGRKVFGSGTRLYVTVSGKDKVKEPTLKAYKQSKIQGDKRTLVCQASDMVPDLVKFSWQTKSSSGDWTNVPDQQVIEQRDEVGKENPPNVVVTSMVIVDENTVKNNNYRCSVKHEGTTAPKTADITKDEGKSSAGNKDVVKATCPPIEENTEQKQKSETMDETPSLYLFIYAYGIMLMKNGVYFVAVSLYLFKRRFGKKNEST